MDADHFDAWLRSLTASASRRGALGTMSGLLAGLAGGVLGLVPLAPDAAAKKKKKVTLCHSGQTITVSKKAKKKHLKHGDSLGACPTAPPLPTTLPPCANGVKDGTETDVDCGGSCSRCADGRTCGDRDDCASALCVLTADSGLMTCQACPSSVGCPVGCVCDTTVGGQKVCDVEALETEVSACTQCPSGTNCVDLDPADGLLQCYRFCAAD